MPNHDVAFRMIKTLMELGIEATKEDALRQTPLFYACREGNMQAISHLVKEGRDNVNRQDKYGQTPIYYAVREGHIRTTQLLIELGADFDHADTKQQRPLYYAVQHNRFEMVKFLIDRGADLHKEDKKGATPTIWAKKQNRPEILSLLLEAGGTPLNDPRRAKDNRSRPAKEQPVVEAPAQPKVPENDKKLPKRFMLTKLREGGFYSPMTDQEFEEFKRQNSEIAQYFE